MGFKVGPIKVKPPWEKGGGVKVDGIDIGKIKDEIFDDVEKAVNTVKDEAVGQVKQVEKDVLYQVNTAGNNCVGAIEKAGTKVVGEIGDEAEKLIKAAIDELAAAITKEGLKQFRKAAVSTRDKLKDLDRRRPDLHDAINDITIYLQVGPIKMEFSRFLTRVEQLITSVDIWIDRPPKMKRSEIRTMVNTLGPDTIDLGISVNFALLIGSKELGVGCGLDKIKGALIEELLDLLLEALGVPE